MDWWAYSTGAGGEARVYRHGARAENRIFAQDEQKYTTRDVT